ncbi:MAG: phosphatidylglycerol lysyltransferase domain-containing protein [Candidatus Zixiibacteriota bacterium]
MTGRPEFPVFKPIALEDRDFIQDIFDQYQPQTSELTFTNFFIWRLHYGIRWSTYGDWLFFLCDTDNDGSFAFQPIGPPPRLEVVGMLLQWLVENGKDPRIERADQRLVSEIQQAGNLLIEPNRDHFDYVYRTEDLIHLTGNKYHSKRNHISQFLRTNSFTYASLTDYLVKGCLELSETWCELRRCEEDLNLLEEWEAVRQALSYFRSLKLEGGVILIGNKVEAFALGELLNQRTAVVHIEKANPEIPGLYALINQQFCEKSWQSIPYVNREEDLGEPGLRKAKLSYHPDHMAEKFRIRLAKGN